MRKQLFECCEFYPTLIHLENMISGLRDHLVKEEIEWTLLGDHYTKTDVAVAFWLKNMAKQNVTNKKNDKLVKSGESFKRLIL